jgi:hypothetical protein
MNKLCAITTIIIVLLNLQVMAQGGFEKQRTISDKISFGGGIGLQLGTYTGIEISPTVGYTPIEPLMLGIKGTYQYYGSQQYGGTSLYGGSLFSMYNVFKPIGLYGEFECLNLETKYYDPYKQHSTNDRFWVALPQLGIAYIQPTGPRSKIIIMALWCFNDSYYSPYSNPIFRISFMM